MEKPFAHEDKTRQQKIIVAAQQEFGKSGYKKTSIADIAQQAGVSKSQVFYYFGSKLALYCFLLKDSRRLMYEEFSQILGKLPADFFERIVMLSNTKIQLSFKHPHLFEFVASAVSEGEPELKDALTEWRYESREIAREQYFDDIAIDRFADPSKMEEAYRYIIWAADGFADEVLLKNRVSLQEMTAEIQSFYNLLEILKKHYYKPEYLSEK